MNGHVRRRTSKVTGQTTYQIVTYLARDSATGKPIYGPCPTFKTRTAANAYLHDLLVDLRGGTYSQRRPKTAVTVRELWSRYIRDEAPARLKPKTLQSYREAMAVRVLPALGKLPADKLAAPLVERLKGQMLADGLSADTVRCYLAPLRATTRWAVAVGHLRRDPCSAVRNPTVRRDEQPVLDAGGISAAIAAAKGTQLELAALIAGTTGLRIGEVVALRWSDVALKTGKVRITRSLSQARSGEFGTPKGGRSRTVVLPTFACTALARAKLERRGKADELICQNRRGDPLAPKNASVQYGRTLARHGLVGARPWHTLRHSVLTLLSDHMTPRDLQEWAGHADVKTTLSYYVHAREAAQERGASAMEEALGGSDDRMDAEPAVVVTLRGHDRA